MIKHFILFFKCRSFEIFCPKVCVKPVTKFSLKENHIYGKEAKCTISAEFVEKVESRRIFQEVGRARSEAGTKDGFNIYEFIQRATAQRNRASTRPEGERTNNTADNEDPLTYSFFWNSVVK